MLISSDTSQSDDIVTSNKMSHNEHDETFITHLDFGLSFVLLIVVINVKWYQISLYCDTL